MCYFSLYGTRGTSQSLLSSMTDVFLVVPLIEPPSFSWNDGKLNHSKIVRVNYKAQIVTTSIAFCIHIYAEKKAFLLLSDYAVA